MCYLFYNLGKEEVHELHTLEYIQDIKEIDNHIKSGIGNREYLLGQLDYLKTKIKETK